MKRTLSLLLTFFLGAHLLWADEYGVTLLLRNTTSVSFAFSKKPCLVPSSAELSIATADGDMVSYALGDVKSVVVNDNVSSGIGTVTPDGGAVFRISGSVIEACGLRAGEQVAVSALSGTLLMRRTAGADGCLLLSLEALGKGVFVVSTQSGVGYKFIRR